MLKAHNLLKKCHEDAMTLLKNHKDALVNLIDELMKKRIMTDKEVQAVINKTTSQPVEPTALDNTVEQTTTEPTAEITHDAEQRLEETVEEVSSLINAADEEEQQLA